MASQNAWNTYESIWALFQEPLFGSYDPYPDPQHCFKFVSRVADPHHFYADPYLAFYSNADLDPAFHFNSDPASYQMEICNLFSIDPPELHFECSRLSTALSGSFCSLKRGSRSSFQKCNTACKDMNDFRIEFSYPWVKTIRFLLV